MIPSGTHRMGSKTVCFGYWIFQIATGETPNPLQMPLMRSMAARLPLDFLILMSGVFGENLFSLGKT